MLQFSVLRCYAPQLVFVESQSPKLLITLSQATKLLILSAVHSITLACDWVTKHDTQSRLRDTYSGGHLSLLPPYCLRNYYIIFCIFFIEPGSSAYSVLWVLMLASYFINRHTFLAASRLLQSIVVYSRGFIMVLSAWWTTTPKWCCPAC